MLEQLHPGKARLDGDQYVPPFLGALIGAAGHGNDLLRYVEAITRHLGFESFLYGATAMPAPRQEGKVYVFTTMPHAWVARYDQMAYIEVDPRVGITWDSVTPLIWDQSSVRGHGQRCDAFLESSLPAPSPVQIYSVGFCRQYGSVQSNQYLERETSRTAMHISSVAHRITTVAPGQKHA